MSIERNEKIRFHEQGTLEAVTRWISTHHDGIAEWFKNVRRQYQVDRGNVGDLLRVAALLMIDAKGGQSARIGVLDVGGATLEDVTAWSTWDDPTASHRGSQLDEEETQGNGGKAYMYRLFEGAARILGVRDGRRNCKGFEGLPGTVDRGNPGWVPSVAEGREVEISSFEAELRRALQPYDLDLRDLPPKVSLAVKERKAFTLVEAVAPLGLLYKGRIDAEDVVSKVIRHDQCTLCLEQVEFYAIHNGRHLNEGKKLSLPPIPPYLGLEGPIIYEVPDQLPLQTGEFVSTTEGGSRDRGRLVLYTSADNMQTAWKNLKPRWQLTYRTRFQMIGAKQISELAGVCPGAQYIYGAVELAALEPAYVEHGRRRPKPGPLIEALDQFIGEKIRDVAQQINSRRQERLDEATLDEVHEENRRLDEFKNRFLPSYGDGSGGKGDNGKGPGTRGGTSGPEWGTVPEELDCVIPQDGLFRIGAGISVQLRTLLSACARDANGKPVRCTLEWFTSDHRVTGALEDGVLQAKEKGNVEIWVRIKGTAIESARVPVQVWNVDHVLLTPRTIELPLGTRQQVTAEVTDDEGRRSTSVLLDWSHDSEDPFLVRISREGLITANKLGRTCVTAGAGGVWARIPVEVNVIDNPEKLHRGSGFPRLLLTGRDVDPASGTIRQGDPDEPPLWQLPSDYLHNVWWLNLQSPEAAFAFRQRSSEPTLWRAYHAQRVIDMVVLVWMMEEFTRKGDSERQDLWANHQAAMDRYRVRVTQPMWKRLEAYVIAGQLLDASSIEMEA